MNCTLCGIHDEAAVMYQVNKPSEEFKTMCMSCMMQMGMVGEALEGEDIPTTLSKEIGIKHDGGKLRYDLLPWNCLKEIVKVYTYGAKLYGDNNWQNVEPHSRYESAMFRHFMAAKSGEREDSETGIDHHAHMAWNAIALLYFSLKEKEHEKNQ